MPISNIFYPIPQWLTKLSTKKHLVNFSCSGSYWIIYKVRFYVATNEALLRK